MGNSSATDTGHILDMRCVPQNFINFDMPRCYLNGRGQMPALGMTGYLYCSRVDVATQIKPETFEHKCTCIFGGVYFTYIFSCLV